MLVAVVGLWIAYLVPHRLRYRQQLLESRTDDRFSGALRVVRVTRAAGALPVRQVAGGAGRVWLHPPAAGGGGTVDRPHRLNDRVIADAVRRSAAEQAQRAAYLSRRAAGARRRALLAGTLAVLTIAGWAGVVAGSLVALAGAVPTLLLGSVLLLGRRAVVLGRRADAAWLAAAPDRAARRALIGPTAVGRAVRPSDASTEVFARVPAEAPVAPVEVAEQRAEVADRTWEPVPVPRPSYTLKPAVRRAEPAPLVLDEPAAASALEAVPAVQTTGSIDLDAILARRRAAGE